MGHFSSMFNGLERLLSIKKSKSGLKSKSQKSEGKEEFEVSLKDAKKNESILRTSGVVNVEGSKNVASVFTKRGQKGVNQDCCIVWEEFGCQEDMMFCGIFDGHGPWGHFVAKNVRDSMPTTLLHHFQETLSQCSLDSDSDHPTDLDEKLNLFSIWRHCYLKTCASVDRSLLCNRKIDAVYSGTTALTIVRQGDVIYIANVGDSRAVLATTSENGDLVPVQLTVDFKPNLSKEAERIIHSNGRIFCLDDEPGIYRVWLPNRESPGLAMSRAFGDYCIKDFGLISVPDVTQRRISCKDQFVILATDGVWDVVSNEEAIQIISTAPDWAQSAKNLVKYASHAWKRKRKGIATDDISAVVLFFRSSSLSDELCSAATPN